MVVIYCEEELSIELLKRTGLLEESEEGSYIQTNELIPTGSEIESLAVNDLHAQMADLARNAVEEIPKEECDISGLTMGVSRDTFEAIKSELKEFRQRIRALISEDQVVERMYRLNMQFFPLSKEIKEEE